MIMILGVALKAIISGIHFQARLGQQHFGTMAERGVGPNFSAWSWNYLIPNKNQAIIEVFCERAGSIQATKE